MWGASIIGFGQYHYKYVSGQRLADFDMHIPQELIQKSYAYLMAHDGTMHRAKKLNS